MQLLIELLSTTLAIIGVALNNRKLIACFYVWIISNSITAGIHLHAGLYGLLLRDIVFLILAFEGIYLWKKIK